MKILHATACAVVMASLAGCATPVDRAAPLALEPGAAAVVSVRLDRDIKYLHLFPVDLANRTGGPYTRSLGGELRLISPVDTTASARGTLEIALREHLYEAVYIRLSTRTPPGQYAVTSQRDGSAHSETDPLVVDCYSNRAPVIDIQPGKITVVEPIDDLMARLEATENGEPTPAGSLAALQDVQTALKDYPAIDAATAQLAPIVASVELKESPIAHNGQLVASAPQYMCDVFMPEVTEATVF